MSTAFRLLKLADRAFTVEFSELTGAVGARYVRRLRQRIEEDVRAGNLIGVLDLISASRSLTVCLDPLKADYDGIRESVLQLAEREGEDTLVEGKRWTLPVCYDKEFALDLDYVSQQSGVSKAELIELHSANAYDVLLIGFLPGFPFMAQTPEALHLPRRSEPRLQVPPGSVAIANGQTAIYPWESPGGWHLIGACPVPLFDVCREQPNLLAAGDSVHFKPVDKDVFFDIKNRFSQGIESLTDYQVGVA